MKQYTTSCVLTALFVTLGLGGCAQNQAGGNAGTAAEQVIPPVRHAAMTPYTTLQLHPSIAAQIDKLQGLRWSVVLQEGSKVYVGAYPDYGGNPKPGAAPPAQYRGPKSFDSPQELQQKSPDEFMRALNELPPRYDSYDYRPKDRMGYLSPQTQAAVRKTVQRALPNVQSVLITTDVASAALLRGYADYMEAGGDMSRYMTQFHQRISKIWPGGKGVAPDRPSASPDFGALGTPADQRTPVRGSVRQ